MTTHFRKLLVPLEDHNPSFISSKETPEPSTPLKTQETENTSNNNNNNFPPSYTNLKLNPPLDSAMALTVLVLLTALFFMGFFSIYIRRFADESSVDPTRRRRSSTAQSGSATGTTSYFSSSRGCSKGVDPTVVKSLPVYAYFPGKAKQGTVEEMECAICLSEFEEKEWLKEIPYCGHVFHVECIDTWLESHVTCPLCRTATLVVEREKDVAVHVVVTGGEERRLSVDAETGGGDGGGGSGGGVSNGEVRLLVVDGSDTWNVEERGVGPTSGRESSSCVLSGERLRLHRSLSF